jgi:hypothetical protein
MSLPRKLSHVEQLVLVSIRVKGDTRFLDR